MGEMNAISSILFATAIIAGIFYAAKFLHLPPSTTRTIAKTMPVSLLAFSSFISGQPVELTAAIALSAMGDAWLAGKGEQRFIAGLGCFLLAHLAYVWVMWHLRDPTVSTIILGLAIIATVALAYLVLSHLWPHLGKLKIPVILYTIAIVLMANSAISTAISFPLILGVALFLISDTVLAHETFVMNRFDPNRRFTADIIWNFYFFGQALIVATFLYFV